MYILTKKIEFPPVHFAAEDGLLAIGGDLSTERLSLAYRSGIFPWFNEGEPIIWYSPENRMVLFPEELRISKSMRKVIRDQQFKITFNTAFEQVLYHCKTIYRPDQGGTWITDDMENAYLEMHKKGIAKSVEVWENDVLVGGLYGIDLGSVFCGESMFSTVSNASKMAFIYLVEKLKKENYKLIDCQVHNDHLASLGAREIDRIDFLKYL
ncbi:MAG: leucyl/phenylalanyl-tRNA--protein transferase [Flavobacteriaceae bacterium]|nr:MAG: leucyl/phenylalanyl-tRNA--protein transferase [Flavobacteriaceae bacterium]